MKFRMLAAVVAVMSIASAAPAQRSVVAGDGGDREAVIARVELGLSYEEIAALLDKPSADAARSRLRVGLELNSDFTDNHAYELKVMHVLSSLNDWGALGACWSMPIWDRRKRVVGTFALYYRDAKGSLTTPLPALAGTRVHVRSAAGLLGAERRLPVARAARAVDCAPAPGRNRPPAVAVPDTPSPTASTTRPSFMMGATLHRACRPSDGRRHRTGL